MFVRAYVADGEGASHELVRLQLVAARLGCQLLHLQTEKKNAVNDVLKPE
jgi:hypothetical protein